MCYLKETLRAKNGKMVNISFTALKLSIAFCKHTVKI